MPRSTRRRSTPFSVSRPRPPDHDLRPSGELHHIDGRDQKKRRTPKPLSPQTIDDVIRSARECWQLARDRNLTAYAPPAGYYTPGFVAPRSRKPKGRYIIWEEIGALIDSVARGHIRDLLLLELGTGVRTGAVADLVVSQVHLDLGVINFDRENLIESSKGRPISPITGQLWSILRRLVANAHPSGYLLHYNGKPLAEGSGNYYQMIARVKKRAGISETDGAAVNWYSIRRTWADTLAEFAPAAAVSQAMGHGGFYDRADRRKLFEEGSPTTEIYKRRRLRPVYVVGEALDQQWWSQIQPYTTLHLSDPSTVITAEGPYPRSSEAAPKVSSEA